METEVADIDDVLNESEALLDRLQFSDDVFDGGSSLASIGSTSILEMSSSVAETSSLARTNVSAGQNRVRNGVLSEPRSTFDASTSEPSQVQLTMEQQEPQSSPGPAKWEKVSSATMGDDDYVPIADYTKEKRTAVAAPSRNARAKISRLEAYREKARRQRRRRRRIGAILAFFIFVVLWYWMRKGSRAGQNDSLQSTDNVNDTMVDNNRPSDLTSRIDNGTEEPRAVEQQMDEACPRNFTAELSRILDESLCGSPGESEVEGKGRLEDNTHASSDTDTNPKDLARRSCKNIISRIFSKKCRRMARERKRVLAEDMAQ